MKFKQYILSESISEKEFIKAIASYSSIDDALVSLQDKYVEYYLSNINSKKLNNSLKKLHIQGLHETQGLQEEEVERTLGYAPSDNKIVKNIKYKGQYITLEYDRDLGSWFPAIRFRSIISAMKYIKNQVDYNETNI